MQKLIGSIALACLVVGNVQAATGQQEKMKNCSAEAKQKSLKGDERKTFMKTCLSAKKDEPEATQAAQQDKMKACSKEAGEKALKGEERKKFMSGCLKA